MAGDESGEAANMLRLLPSHLAAKSKSSNLTSGALTWRLSAPAQTSLRTHKEEAACESPVSVLPKVLVRETAGAIQPELTMLLVEVLESDDSVHLQLAGPVAWRN